MNLRCFIDGNALCIVKEDFVNIQVSEIVFVDLTSEQIKEIKELSE